MVEEFSDTGGASQHNAFQAWRRRHQGGVFLTMTAKRRGNLHFATACWHTRGFGHRFKEGAGSLTRAAKACSADPLELLNWAAAREIEVKPCAHCIDRDGFAQVMGEVSATAEPAAPASAIEGRARETLSISRSRSGALREEALARAGGVCAACRFDFSTLFQGLGLRALEVHHRRQLRLYETPRATSVQELAAVCANCHAILHADPQNAMSVETLRSMHRRAARVARPL